MTRPIFARIFAWHGWYLQNIWDVCNSHDTGNKKCSLLVLLWRWLCEEMRTPREIFSRSVKKVFVWFDNSVLCCHCDWYSRFGFEFAGFVALSSEGRFKVAKILINFQLIINCYFNEAFPFVIIYKINFDIWKLNFLSNFGTIHLTHWLAKGLKISLNRGSRTHYLVDTEAVAASTISPLKLLE